MTTTLILIAIPFAWAALAGIGMRWARPRIGCGVDILGTYKCGEPYLSGGGRWTCARCDFLAFLMHAPPLWVVAIPAWLIYRTLKGVYLAALGPETKETS